MRRPDQKTQGSPRQCRVSHFPFPVTGQRIIPATPVRRHAGALLGVFLAVFFSLVFVGWNQCAAGAEPVAGLTGYDVQGYAVEGKLMLSSNVLAHVFGKYTGTNVSLQKIVQAAADLQAAYQDEGYPAINIVIARQKITNGIVTMDVFQGAVAQIVVSGRRYLNSGVPAETETNLPAMEAPAVPETPAVAAITNAPAQPAVPLAPATPEQIKMARLALIQELVNPKPVDHRIHVVSTNAGPHFAVEHYVVTGNSVLTPQTIALALTNVDGAFGTNVSLDGIRTAVAELQGAYRSRGYVTVAVGLPQQKLTNATLKLQVTEGRLASIEVKGNRFFSSNNVMRALPGLHTNMILNGLVFQAELNRANANRDRQIYPVVSPGPDSGTSDLQLRVKDQLPLHGKVEFNNENSPGTPDMRINTSAVADNLWQMEHSLGVQYSFSPEEYKQGHIWDWYDEPAVANYSAFYRMPLGNPSSIEDAIDNNPGNFGYNEATRKFNLPPASGQAELNIYASRSTIDTGVGVLSDDTILNDPGVRSITSETDQQDNTINNDIGFRLSAPILPDDTLQSFLSGGVDYKSYQLDGYKTNIFTDTEITYDRNNRQTIRQIRSYNPVPDNTNGISGVTVSQLNYLPLNFRYDGSMHNQWGLSTFGLGLSGNVWFSGSVSNLHGITSSTKSSGHWVVVTPSFSQNFEFVPNWTTTVRADGQWANEPLISNEQFGGGGVNSVRGYHEGEVFGDTGWHVSVEQQTPPHVVGIAYGKTPLTIRGTVYMDYARVFLLDPQERPSETPLWGTGFGAVASVGSHFDARFLFSMPLLSAGTVESFQPFFNFALTAQF
jgi:hemolysin activation/secretion protein